MRGVTVNLRWLRDACLLAGVTFCLGDADAVADHTTIVTVHGETLTIEARDVTTRDVLEALSEQTGLMVRSHAALDERLTTAMRRATLAETVRRLLRRHSYLLQNAASGNSVLHIFADDAGDTGAAWATRRTTSFSHEIDGKWVDDQSLLSSADAADREKAMFAIGERHDVADHGYLLMGLNDPDPGVRGEAIAAIAEIGDADFIGLLGVALQDTHISVRLEAIDALGDLGGTDAIALIRRVTADPDPTVREAASEWLLELR